MIALIQRVMQASVVVDGQTVGVIDNGLLVLLGVEKDDTPEKSARLCERVLGYRIFSDEQGKMNLNVQQAGGSVLVVSQFTLVADTQRACALASLAEQPLRTPSACTSTSWSAAKSWFQPKPAFLLQT